MYHALHRQGDYQMARRRTIEMRFPNPIQQFQEERSYFHLDCAPLFDTTYFNPSTMRQLKAGKQITFSVLIYYYDDYRLSYGSIGGFGEKKQKKVSILCSAIDVDTAPVTTCEYCGNGIEEGSKKSNFIDLQWTTEKMAWKKYGTPYLK